MGATFFGKIRGVKAAMTQAENQDGDDDDDML